ncbi:hypothetical protein AJ79_03831 [Helicocarpus griseus UAMH5409]|uniref:Bromo domain-containing protein n=1 Tax=Helicocarpus griseus UAMH5409 TaxID=1447875 RepID=A0A2B7XMX6_9EURO|nr:hypothetical protein AJ79_03831 [Helicocarpus griseus UAMH5409]
MTTKRRGTLAGSPEGPSKGHKRRRTSVSGLLCMLLPLNFQQVGIVVHESKCDDDDALLLPLDSMPRVPTRHYPHTYIPETYETPEKTTEAGLELLAQIKEAVDKHGQLVATEFLHLPNRKENKQYYQAIRLPIALDTVENKLKKHEYPRLTPVECDLRRMVSNAKFYNDKGSAIFSNAERIRKLVASRMAIINPAYKDPDYAPFATPVPEEEEEEEEQEKSEEPEGAEDAEEEEKESAQQTPAVDQMIDSNDDENFNFEGETFESAQEKIIAGMIRLKDSDGEEVFFPFLSMPDRNLYKEYYDIIKHPVSLRAILKLVRGTDGRKNSTKTTPFKTWDAFVEEVSYIWRNAREFNEDGSEIVLLAGSLEEYFHRLLAAARKKIPEPAPTTNGDSSAPRLKLRMGSAAKTPEPAAQKLTLRLPGKGSDQSTTGMEHRQGGVSIDNEALRRQQEHVKAASNGLDVPDQPTPPARSLRDRSGSGTRAVSTRSTRSQDQEQQRSAPGASPARSSSAVKIEGTGGTTPNLKNVASQEPTKPSIDSQNRIPSVSAEPSKISPSGAATPIQSNNPKALLQAFGSRPSSYPSPAPAVSRGNLKLRKPGIGPLLSSVKLSSHPTIDHGHPFLLDIPPSPTLTHQSITVNLPAKCGILCISPTISPDCLRRHTQLTVTIGSTQKLAPMLSPSRTMDPAKPYYEARLGIGVTKIMIEMTAMAPRTAVRWAPTTDLDYERLTIYAHLMRV